jgi:protein-S-isoprenylcysteine O-methyltransferase Ste14
VIETWIPFALVGVILLGESTSLGKRLDSERKDCGSYFLFRGILAAAYIVSFYLLLTRRFPERLALGSWSALAGAVLTVSGTVLRVWSMKTLGQYFTRVVHASPHQKVIKTGPYRLIRHPSYTGAGLAALGVALSMGSAGAVALIGGAFAIGVSWRIYVEERALVQTIGEPYREYMKRTKRFIPYVF